jgi:acyl-CoA thioester hydrolase
MAQIEIYRTVEWFDTDAAGHQHHSCILRYVESAEAALLREYDLAWLFGETPRIRHEVTYRRRLWFGETVTVVLKVARLGVTSLEYSFEVKGSEGLAADGRLVVAHASPESPTSTPWPQAVVDAFGPIRSKDEVAVSE